MAKGKKQDGSSAGLLAFAVVGLLAVGGVVAYRKQQEEGAGMAPEPTATEGTGSGAGAGAGGLPGFGVDYSRPLLGGTTFGVNFGRPSVGGGYSSYTDWANSFLGGGLLVTPAGGTRTPTSSYDLSPTTGGGYGTPAFGAQFGTGEPAPAFGVRF